MRIVPAGVIAVLAISLASCGSTDAHRSPAAIDSYLSQVDVAEAPLISRTSEINAVIRNFSVTSNSGAEVRALKAAANLFATTLEHVRAIKTPPESVKLRGDLVRLLSLENHVANELVWTTRYVPEFERAVAPLTAASKQLSAGVGRIRSSSSHGSSSGNAAPTSGAADASYAATFGAYATALEHVLKNMNLLSAPPELQSSLVVEKVTLRESVGLCLAIAADFSRHADTTANAAISRLYAATSTVNAAARQRAAVTAVQAYDARLAEISGLALQLKSDRQALVKSFG